MQIGAGLNDVKADADARQREAADNEAKCPSKDIAVNYLEIVAPMRPRTATAARMVIHGRTDEERSEAQRQHRADEAGHCGDDGATE